MPDHKKDFDLGDYVAVKDRIARFYELYAGGRLETSEVRATSEPDNVPRVWVQAKAYRTEDDPHPGIGWSWMELPGSTSYTRGSELENAETSAWGRAIGALGVLIDFSIASQNEVENKEGQTAPAVARTAPADSTPMTQARYDAELNQPQLDEAEIDSLVASNTEVLRPASPAAPQAPTCPVHASEMRKNSRGWYCTRRMPNGTFCTEEASAKGTRR